ncbi:MAG TPA: 50S ribosomal protein L20 [bacterium]|jgi:large subunit ribosomal protein L20|nr:50S ribosomal protein L20 [bacterium]HOG37951.1 50S ribosomal protein L20 [bacterium]HQI03009.1 50S ribosomal protein L20 [bacterium]
MPRVKRGVTHLKKRKKILKKAKGYKWGRKSTIRAAKTAVKKAGQHALHDRRKKKGVMRSLWTTKLNAALRKYEISYSKFIDMLKKQNIELDRKILAEIAEKNPEIFEKIVKSIQK